LICPTQGGRNQKRAPAAAKPGHEPEAGLIEGKDTLDLVSFQSLCELVLERLLCALIPFGVLLSSGLLSDPQALKEATNRRVRAVDDPPVLFEIEPDLPLGGNGPLFHLRLQSRQCLFRHTAGSSTSWFFFQQQG
jgi:hypothetical protein